MADPRTEHIARGRSLARGRAWASGPIVQNIGALGNDSWIGAIIRHNVCKLLIAKDGTLL